MKIKNSIGLTFDFLENGSVRCIEAGPVRISLKASTPFSRSGTNIFIRKRKRPFEFSALLGPESNSRFKFNAGSFIAEGHWAGLDYTCVLQLSQKSLSWQWQIKINNVTADEVELDLIWVQDAGLKPVTEGLINEYYVSQYLERIILEDNKYGQVICCRQNMNEAGGNPWLIMSCINTPLSASVDGMQFYGKTYRETGIPEGLLAGTLGGEYAGESSVLALQETPFTLGAGKCHKSVFMASFLQDHPEATSINDLNRLPSLLSEFPEELSNPDPFQFFPAEKNQFNLSSFLPVDDLNGDELNGFFGRERRHAEIENGRLLSFFYGQNTHVVLRSKEILVDRPHGNIMQASAGYAPDESILSTTAWAFGVFNSHLSQGNTNFNVLLSVCTSPFNLSPESGQRIFVRVDGKYWLLGVPSAFEIGLNHCRWIYKHRNYCFEVRSWTSKKAPQVNMEFKVLRGDNVRLLVTHHFDRLNGWTAGHGTNSGEYIVKPGPGSMIAGKFPDARFRILVNSGYSGYKVCGDELLYSDNKSRGNSLFIFDVPDTDGFCVSVIGEVCFAVKEVKFENAEDQFIADTDDAQAAWQDLCLNLSMKGNHKDVSAIHEILPWFGMNALTHFLTPYGLEQFSGAAWGTRDVAQGPFDLLLCMEKYTEARQVLRIIFSNQNADGGWPQWWMFDSYPEIRADSSHGDVYYWCILALSNYIKVTGDLKILDELLPYYHDNGSAHAVRTPLSEHVGRLIRMIVDSFIPGTALVPFGGGDWNDSLQPVSKELARRMISAWTVEMNYQAFDRYSKVYEKTDVNKAAELKQICERIKTDFYRYLIKDGVVAGYGLLEKDHTISLLLHPADDRTNIQYSILPMERGIISGIFTKEQADLHLDLIEPHLKGPDGARLMNRPLRYKGGIQAIFQRAETSTFFGREIGLMYVHEHIRFAEVQAIMGRADAFVKALRQANPVAYREIVLCGDIRQSNCYYSSSDVSFKNRYEADERYDEIKSGKIILKGGWRVYSSGPGIYIGLVVTRLLGLRLESGNMIIDPVVPDSFDGFSASLDILGHPVTFIYSVKQDNFGPKAITINGKALTFTYEETKYRKGGAVIPTDRFLALLDRKENVVEIEL